MTTSISSGSGIMQAIDRASAHNVGVEQNDQQATELTPFNTLGLTEWLKKH
jgi:hypothetical protein